MQGILLFLYLYYLVSFLPRIKLEMTEKGGIFKCPLFNQAIPTFISLDFATSLFKTKRGLFN